MSGANFVVAELESDGFTLRLTPGGFKVWPGSRLDADLRAKLQAHRRGIAELLQRRLHETMATPVSTEPCGAADIADANRAPAEIAAQPPEFQAERIRTALGAHTETPANAGDHGGKFRSSGYNALNCSHSADALQGAQEPV